MRHVTFVNNINVLNQMRPLPTLPAISNLFEISTAQLQQGKKKAILTVKNKLKMLTIETFLFAYENKI